MIAQKFSVVNIISLTFSKASSVNGLAISPSPCVRPGSVAVIARAARSSITQP